MPHDLYVGVDWSGRGRNGRSPGLRIATCGPGEAAPVWTAHPRGWNWRRDEVLGFLNDLASRQRVLAGLDFSFAYPWCDATSYFPCHPAPPPGPRELWAAIDAVCAQAPWFYGGPLLASSSPFADYFLTQRERGARYAHRLRATEEASAAAGARALCTFHCVGAQVGTGSVAGMRVLHAIATRHAEAWSIWPFDPRDGRSTIVEVFPSLLRVLAGQGGGRLTEAGVMNAALSALGSMPLPCAPATEDVADAILIAAGLRHLDRAVPEVWAPAGMSTCAETHEGWILGT